tara:strand:- start:1168 stop:1413 length:246 start_codon:yes stop_codon:yes gene_type:complete
MIKEIKVQDPYSVLGFKVQQITMLLHNLEFHIRGISESRGIAAIDDRQIMETYRALDRTLIENLRFNHHIDKLPEVKDGSH